MSKKVLVVMGGFSAERDVSLVSGKGIVDALNQEGFETVAYDLTSKSDFLDVLKKEKPFLRRALKRLVLNMITA